MAQSMWQLGETKEEMVIHNIVYLASEVGLKGVNEKNVEELLQFHDKSYH